MLVRAGTIATAGPSTSNATTAAAFALPGPATYTVQADVDVYVVAGATATAAEGVRVAANERVDFNTRASSLVLSILPVTAGAAAVKVFRKTGPVE